LNDNELPAQNDLNYITIIKMNPVRNAINNGIYPNDPHLSLLNIFVAVFRKTPFIGIDLLFLIKPRKTTRNATSKTIAIAVLPGASQ